jgi:hypothetical protein
MNYYFGIDTIVYTEHLTVSFKHIFGGTTPADSDAANCIIIQLADTIFNES